MGRKSVVIQMGACFRAASNHPFLVVMLCFLAFLYRSFPYVFSLLLSAFPVIFCTGVLLGVLLTFSHPRDPEIRREEGMIHKVGHLKTGMFQNVSGYRVQRHVDNETSRDSSVAGSIEDVSSDDNISREDDSDGNFSDVGSRLTEKSREIQFGRLGRRLHNARFELLNKERGDGLLSKDHCLPISKLSSKNFEVENDKSVGSCDSERVNIGSPCCLGKHVEEEEDDDDDDDDDNLDSGSDQAESSSPDASVTDIVSMLDELHPLLDENAPQPVNMSPNDSRSGSDGSCSDTSEHFSRSNDSGTESDHSTEEQTEVQVEDDEDDEEIQRDKDELTKSAIKWTEEDQKNVMDVGSTELERNQLLERVMERRRSRKCVSMMAGKELLTLENSGPQRNVAPIVTARHNPFDLLPDSYEEEGLPPIPGSAPSSLAPRKNPFDIPYYSNEEKSDLSGGNSDTQLNFLDFQPKGTFVQRRKFLNVGPSVFGPNKQDVDGGSYFVGEQMAPEGTSYSMAYTQLNDSKVSSGPETESMGSVEDPEDKNVIKEDVEEKIDEGNMEEKKQIGHGSSHSSEDEGSLELDMGGLKNILVDEIGMKMEGAENHRAVEQSTSHEGTVPNLRSELETLQQSYNSSLSTSTSSSSEASERIFDEKEEKPSTEERRHISRQPSLDGSELSISTTLVEEGQRREPVYDSSPPRLKRNFSSSSIASELHERWFPPIQVKRTVSFAERVIMMGSNRDSEISIPTVEEILKSSPISLPASIDESETKDAVVRNEHEASDDTKDQLSSSISDVDTQDGLNQEDDSISKSSADQEIQDKMTSMNDSS